MQAKVLLFFVMMFSVRTASYKKVTYATQSQTLLSQLLDKARGGGLSSMPFCIYAESESPISEFALESNLSWPAFQKSDDHEGALFVELNVFLVKLVEVDAKTQTITLILGITMLWEDCRLGWLPEKHGDFDEELIIDPKVYREYSLFKPYLELKQSINMKDADNTERHISISSDGNVLMIQDAVTTISCKFDIVMYPFDTHTCEITFEAVVSRNFLRLKSQDAPLHKKEIFSDFTLGDFSRHDQWTVTVLPPELLLHKACTRNITGSKCFVDNVVYKMLLRRNPNYLLLICSCQRF